MEIIRNLFDGAPQFWGGGVAHSVMILSLVIALGLILGKLKVANISLGLAWVLFIGIVFGYAGFNLDPHLLHFMREFGLILFVYSIGLQVGPSIVSSFRRGGLRLNLLAITTIALSIVTMLIITYSTGTDVPTMAGILSGAVTNTPGLGAAQQAFSDLHHTDAPQIAMGYAVSYPIGILGVIACYIILKYALRINTGKEEQSATRGLGATEEVTVRHFAVHLTNKQIEGMSLSKIHAYLNRDFVISRMLPEAASQYSDIISGATTFHLGDRLLVIASPADVDSIVAFFGEKAEVDWKKCDKHNIASHILITKPGINGKTIAQLRIRTLYGANITRVYRSGVELVATGQLRLQMGDRLTVVGSEHAVRQTEKLLGNYVRQLNMPNLIPIFLGIALGCVLANIPFYLPGIDHPLKLGLTGGPLVIAILFGYFGPKYKIITYNTISANLMIQKIGICLFLACVGLGCGKDFFQTVMNTDGLAWWATEH